MLSFKARSKPDEEMPTLNPVPAAAHSISELTALLAQAVQVVEGLRAQCEHIIGERDGLEAELAVCVEELRLSNQRNDEKDRLLGEALNAIGTAKSEIRSVRLAAEWGESDAAATIAALQDRIADFEDSAADRLRGIEIEGAPVAERARHILDLQDFAEVYAEPVSRAA